MNRRTKIIFTISLLLNIVLIGAGAGMAYKMHQDPFPGDMSPQARAFMGKIFEQGRAEVKPLIDETKAKRKIVESILTAETFDRDAYTKAAGDMLDSRDRISRKKAEIMGRALVDVPAADRKEFAGRILDGLEGRKGGKGRHSGQMGKDGERPPEPR